MFYVGHCGKKNVVFCVYDCVYTNYINIHMSQKVGNERPCINFINPSPKYSANLGPLLKYKRHSGLPV